MKYQPALPEHNDNISHEHPLKDFVLILAALSALVGIWTYEHIWVSAGQDVPLS